MSVFVTLSIVLSLAIGAIVAFVLRAVLRAIQVTGRLLALMETETSRPKHYGAIFIGTPTNRPGLVVASATSGQKKSSTQEITIPDAVAPGAIIVSWGPCIINLVRVHDSIILEKPAPFCFFPHSIKAGAKIVFSLSSL